MLQFVNQLQQSFGLGIRASSLSLARQVEQQLNFRLFQRQAIRVDGNIHLRLTIQFGPVVRLGVLEQRSLRLRRFQSQQAPLQRRANGGSAGRHQALHQNHQKTNVPLLCHQCLVVTVPHIVGHGFIQALLGVVTSLPGHRLQACNPRLEQGLAFGINGRALLGANHKRAHALSTDAAFIRKRIPIKELHQPHKLISFSLVWRG